MALPYAIVSRILINSFHLIQLCLRIYFSAIYNNEIFNRSAVPNMSVVMSYEYAIPSIAKEKLMPQVHRYILPIYNISRVKTWISDIRTAGVSSRRVSAALLDELQTVGMEDIIENTPVSMLR